jgi:hypothetical protein
MRLGMAEAGGVQHPDHADAGVEDTCHRVVRE